MGLLYLSVIVKNILLEILRRLGQKIPVICSTNRIFYINKASSRQEIRAQKFNQC